MRGRRVALILLAAALAGCLIDAAPPMERTRSDEQSPATPPVVRLPPGDIRAVHAQWPDLPHTVEALSNLSPSWLGLEMPWDTRWGEPVEASLAAIVGDTEHILPTTFARANRSWTPGEPEELLGFRLANGIAALAEANPALVATDEISFAAARIGVPTLNGSASLFARIRVVDPGGAERVLEKVVGLGHTGNHLVIGQAYYDQARGKFAVHPAPGAFVPRLEERALHAWAAGDRLLRVGSTGEIEPPGPPSLDLLVLTGLRGGVVRVESSR